MFTGIIQAVGKVRSLQQKSGDLRIQIDTAELDMREVCLGDSIAVNGVCLTVTELCAQGFWADVSNETLKHTRMLDYKIGSAVNLEKALTLSTPLGGHMVSGHVDGLGTIRERFDDARSVRFWIEAPASLQKYIAAKGSITVDGVSLTVNELNKHLFLLNIVPHTVEQTIIRYYQPGARIHLEVDLIARYLERLMTCSADQSTENPPLTAAWVLSQGLSRRR